jgi:hypothetical protein
MRFGPADGLYCLNANPTNGDLQDKIETDS